MKICEYGCNLNANFILSNGKGCCSKSPNSCEGIKLKNKDGVQEIILAVAII
jgi:hypothetical protein